MRVGKAMPVELFSITLSTMIPHPPLQWHGQHGAGDGVEEVFSTLS
jgi:hypothetical protein